MESLYDGIQAWTSMGLHHYGWLFVSLLLVIPAIVCGNMLIFYFEKFFDAHVNRKEIVKPLILNLLGVLACVAVFLITWVQYA